MLMKCSFLSYNGLVVSKHYAGFIKLLFYISKSRLLLTANGRIL